MQEVNRKIFGENSENVPTSALAVDFETLLSPILSTGESKSLFSPCLFSVYDQILTFVMFLKDPIGALNFISNSMVLP